MGGTGDGHVRINVYIRAEVQHVDHAYNYKTSMTHRHQCTVCMILAEYAFIFPGAKKLLSQKKGKKYVQNAW